MSSETEFEFRSRGPPKTAPHTPGIGTRESVQSTDPDPFWSWFDDYLKAIIGIAVLGGQITFTLIVSDIADPTKLNPSVSDDGTAAVFQRETVRLLIALSWLFFTFTLGFAVLTSLLFSGNRRGSLAARLGGAFDLTMTFLLNFLPIGAFLLLSLAAAAYVPVVGWIGVAFTSLFALCVLFFWLFGW
jgi:hypothetical protein